jgi:tight adherence protein C
MIDLLIDRLHDTRFLVTMLTTLAAIATVITVAMPYLVGDNLERRMKTVALERSKIRARERERLARGERVALRQSPKAYMQTVVEQLNLRKWLGEDQVRATLIQAGYRGQGPYVTFLFFRLIMPIAMFVLAILYLFVFVDIKQPTMVKLAITVGAAWLGMRIPALFLKNLITRRQLSIRRAFPDALDLLLICVESGMSIDASFRKVSEEIGSQSIPLAEEFALTTAELSYLQDRRQAYENLSRRTNLEGVRSVCTALIQAERYGTPLGQALRVLAQENRDMRMSEAEKKAAALPPKLTVPMILFFLPVLFIVILGPAAIRVMEVRGR